MFEMKPPSDESSEKLGSGPGRPFLPVMVILVQVVLLATLLSSTMGFGSSVEAVRLSALSSAPSSVCTGPSCDASQDDSDKNKYQHQRFAATKWRKAKDDDEIRGHLAAVKPPPRRVAILDNGEETQQQLDEADRWRAATIKEAEERLRREKEQKRGMTARQIRKFEAEEAMKKEEARRKALLIQEARRKRRQRLEEMESTEDDDEDDEVDIQIEDEEEHDSEETEEEEDEDGQVEDEDESVENSEELVDDEEYVEDTHEDSDDEDDNNGGEEHEDESKEVDGDNEGEYDPNVSELRDSEDEEDVEVKKRLKEISLRRRKWKEEEARMKQREEERKKAEEMQKKMEADVRRQRINEIRKKKRQMEEERLRREELEEERLRKQKEKEEAEERKKEEERLEKRRKEREVERLKKAKEDADRKRKEMEEAEKRRIKLEMEEKRKREEDERERKRKEMEESLKRKQEEEERLRKENEERELKEREEAERLKKEQEEAERIEQQRILELQAEEAMRRKKEQEEVDKRRLVKEEIEKRKREKEEAEIERKEKLEMERREKEEAEKREMEREAKAKKLKEESERGGKVKKAKSDKGDEGKEESDAARKVIPKTTEDDGDDKVKTAKSSKIQTTKEDIESKLSKAEAKKLSKAVESKDKTPLSKKFLFDNIGDEEEDATPAKLTLDATADDDEEDGDGLSSKKVNAQAKIEREKKKREETKDEVLTAEMPWMSGFPEFFAPTADDDVPSECKKQSRIFVQALGSYRTWAMKMYDATAKFPSGVLSGNIIQLGDFDECLSVDVRLRRRSNASDASGVSQDSLPDEGFVARAMFWLADLVRPMLEPVLGARDDPGIVHIRGRYCLVNVDVGILPSKKRPRDQDAALRAALDRALAHSFLRGSVNDSAHFIPRFRTLGWGICVPSGCSARDVELALRGAFSRFQKSGAWGSGVVKVRLTVPPGACHDAPTGPAHHRLPASFFIASGACLFLLSLAIAATLGDRGDEPEELGGVRGAIACFSLKRNWMVLTTPEDPGADDIRCINGVRGLCSLLLYAAHKVVPIAAQPFSNRINFSEAAASPLSLVLRASVVYTDTFLLLSGVLASFHLSRHLSRSGSLDWFNRLVTRIVRLTPTLGAVLMFYAFILEHLGSGPLWGQLVQDNARMCRHSLWRNLLYIQNFWPFEQMCAPHTHQLALDMQLFLLLPPLVWLLVRAWPLATPLLAVLLGASAWLRYHASSLHGTGLLIYHGIKPADLYRSADVSYAQAPHRASAYLVGVMLGYALHRLPRRMKIPSLLRFLGWSSSAILAGWALFGQRHAALYTYRPNVGEMALFSALAPLAWAAACAWLILACHTGNGDFVNSLLCVRPLVLLSRISYSFYLTQFLVFFYNTGSQRSQKPFSVLSVIDLWELLAVLAISTSVTLLVDLPMQSMKSAISRSRRRRSVDWAPHITPHAMNSPQEGLSPVQFYASDLYKTRLKSD